MNFNSPNICNAVGMTKEVAIKEIQGRMEACTILIRQTEKKIAEFANLIETNRAEKDALQFALDLIAKMD